MRRSPPGCHPPLKEEEEEEYQQKQTEIVHKCAVVKMSSGSTCAVVGCYNNSRKLKVFSQTLCLQHQKLRQDCPCPMPYSLHSMPKKEERRRSWLAALRLKHPPKRVYACSYHFVEKRPTELHPDPELYLGYDLPPPKRRRKVISDRARLTQTSKSRSDFKDHDCSVGSSTVSSSAHPTEPQGHSVHTQWEDPSRNDHNYCRPPNSKDVQDKATQCDGIGYFMLQSDSDFLLYTGLTQDVFNILVSTLEGHASNGFTMSVRDQVLMTLVKLKTNRVIGDLSRQFCISQSMTSKIISYWIDKLEEVLRPLIPWLPKETIEATMPKAFKKHFPNTTCIIDCSEIPLQKPDSTGESHNHDYTHNTLKYLVAVAPCGLIMFVSGAYGGQCSDQFITMVSGILDYIKPGDEVMADRGFTINDLLFERKIQFVVPSFKRQEGQTHEEYAACSKEIAHVRIHVEKALGRLKVYKMLTEVVSTSMAPKMNKILRICAALVNLGEDVTRGSK